MLQRNLKLSDFDFDSEINNQCSKFSELLKRRWNELHEERDVFRYKTSNIKERVVNEKYILQLNPDRGIKRRMPEQIDNICQPFDKNKFNFTKVSPKEVLFNIVKDDDSDGHMLLVNVSPLSRYHSLLCPFVSKCLPQVVTEDSLKLAIEIMFIAQDRDLRIAFNSLCGHASVNHLHYHVLIEKNTLPVEVAKCKIIKGPLYCLEDYPIPAFCFQIATKPSVNQACKDIYKLLEYLLKNSIAHNIFLTRGQGVLNDQINSEVIRVLVWPRKSSSGVKQFSTLAFNVAACELSGWFIIYNEYDFENLQLENLEVELRKWKLDGFEDLCGQVESIY